MSDWLGLRGKRAVVVGAGGIGAACARGFLAAGSQVCVIDQNKDRLAELVSEAEDAGTQVTTVAADLNTADACRDALTDATAQLGGVDVLVHSIGMNRRVPMLELGDDDWTDILTTNLSTAYWLGQAAGRVMCQQRYGRLVFLSSVSALLAHKQHAPYAASKGGLNQLLRVMAHEWAAYGVTANGIAPGYTETPLTSEYLARPGVRESLTTLVPAGRLGSPEHVVGPVLFLASDQASFVTGQVLYVDGGRTLV